MRHLYTGLLYVFSWLAPAFRWTSKKFAKWLSVRNQWKVDLKHFERKTDVPLVWFHCASVGEFEQARPVIDALAVKQTVQIAVSFFSPSGYEAKKTFK
ncbi:MAG: glycosyltransferase N-terminal domain-containing protein, partial [Salibacteraceae bacterium]